MRCFVTRHLLTTFGLMLCLSASVNAQTEETESQDTCFATLWGIGADGWDIAAINTITDLASLLVANPETAYEADVNGDCVVNLDDYYTILDCIFYGDPASCVWNTPTCCSVVVDYPPQPCCIGTTGNVNFDPDDKVDIADLSRLIDVLFISFFPLYCVAEGNIDGKGGTDIADITFLIDHLYFNFQPLPQCPE